MNHKRKDLLKLPVRDWDKDSTYDSIYLVPSGKKHDSGWMCIAVIGLNKSKPVEIAAYPDAINWEIADTHDFRMDCTYPSGIVHVWARRHRFYVEDALSSLEIKLVAKEKE